MKKKIRCLLLCLGLTAAVCGCTQEPMPTESETTQITLPTLNQAQTPQEMLNAAAEQTRALDAFSIDYVHIIEENRFALSAQLQMDANGSCTALVISKTFTEDGTTEDEVSRYYHAATCYKKGNPMQEQDIPFTVSQILHQIPEYSGFIHAICAQPLNAIPSYDGSFRFQAENLSRETIHNLLDDVLPEGTDGQSDTAALTIAPEGYLSSLECTGEGLHITLTITAQTENQPIPAPDWVAEIG